MIKLLKSGVLGLALSVAMIGTVGHAATLTFDSANVDPYIEDGFAIDVARIVNGNCDAASGRPCMALNNNDVSVLTLVGGGTFSLGSFWFQFLGRGAVNTLTVVSDLGGVLFLGVNTFGRNDGGQYLDLSGLTLFQNVTSVTFSSSLGGNVRIDDIVAAIPVPAAGLLLFGALGGLAALRRRRKAT